MIDVSVIIPTFNSERYLQRSVLSAISQIGIKTEVIVVDDAGTDNTRAILENLKASNPSIPLKTIYRPSGLGQATARNDGMDIAKGRYIAFLDSDDAFCEDTTLAEWVSAADSQHHDMLIARFFDTTINSQRTYCRQIDLPEKVDHNIQDSPQLVNFVSCWQILYRRDFLNSKNIRFCPKLKQREDRLFVIEAFLKTKSIGVCPQYVIDHYHVPGSSFRQISQNQLEQYVIHLSQLNAAFRNARAGGMGVYNFEAANSIFYLRQLIKYWAPLCRSLYKSRDGKDVVDAYFDELRELISDVPPLYGNRVVEVGREDEILREGLIDLIRICLKNRETPTIFKLVRKNKPDLSTILYLHSKDPSSEEILTRAWSFLRKVYPRKKHGISLDWNFLSYSEIYNSLTDLISGNFRKCSTWVRNFIGNKKRTKKYKSYLNDPFYLHERSRNHPDISQYVNRIIIHVGLPKTGSSSLQQLLERNRFKLISKGIFYPSVGANREKGVRRERTSGHAALFQALLDGKSKKVIFDIIDEIETISTYSDHNIHTIILSAENIVSQRFWHHGRNIHEFFTPFGAGMLEIYCILRHPLGWLISLYNEMCSNPWNKFTDTIGEFILTLDSQGLFDFNEITEKLSEPDFVSNVEVGVFEEIRQSGGIESWFFEKIGVDSSDLCPIDPDHSNQSLSGTQAAILRKLKSIKSLNRSDLATLFTTIRSKYKNGKNVFVTKSMREDLYNFQESHAAIINNFETTYKHKYSLPADTQSLNIDDTLDGVIEDFNKQCLLDESKSAILKYFKLLDESYSEISTNRAFSLRRNGRSTMIEVSVKEYSPDSKFRLYSCKHSYEHSLLFWGSNLTALISAKELKDLFNGDQRKVSLEIGSPDKKDCMEFCIVRLKADSSHWLIPSSAFARFREMDIFE